MNPIAPFPSEDFKQLLDEQQKLIALASDLEYGLYQLAQAPPSEAVTVCQEAGGTLIAALRPFLFRLDQQVLPILESLAGEQRSD